MGQKRRVTITLGLTAVVGLVLGAAFMAPRLPADAADSDAASFSTGKPETFIRHLYAPYAVSNAHSVPDKQVYDADLLALIAKDAKVAGDAGDIPTIDGDLICACQDYDPFTLSSLIVKSDGSRQAKVFVSFTIDKEQHSQTFDLIQTAAGWRVHDIESADAPSLRALLIDAIAAEQKLTQQPGGPKP